MIYVNSKKKVFNIFGLEIIKFSGDYCDAEMKYNGKHYVSWMVKLSENISYQICFDQEESEEYKIFKYNKKGIWKEKLNYLDEIESEKIRYLFAGFVAEYNFNK